MGFLRIWLWLVVAATIALAQTDGFAVMTKPAANEAVPPGSTYKIVWTAGSGKGKVTLSLIGGSSQATLQPVGTIATDVDVTAGSYSWAVPSDEGSMAVYGIKITSETDKEVFQYSFPFQIKEGKASTTTTGKSTATKSATSSTKSSSHSSTASTTNTKSSSQTASTFSTSTTSTTSSTTTEPSATAIPDAQPAGDTANQVSNSSPLSTVAIVGIAVGGVAVLGIISAVLLFLYRRWQLTREQDQMEYASLMHAK